MPKQAHFSSNAEKTWTTRHSKLMKKRNRRRIGCNRKMASQTRKRRRRVFFFQTRKIKSAVKTPPLNHKTRRKLTKARLSPKITRKSQKSRNPSIKATKSGCLCRWNRTKMSRNNNFRITRKKAKNSKRRSWAKWPSKKTRKRRNNCWKIKMPSPKTAILKKKANCRTDKRNRKKSILTNTY